MSETGILWTHWGHLATKPVVALPIWWVASLVLPMAWAIGVALLVPAAVSLWRKQKLWPGCLQTQTMLVSKDEVADSWAALVVVLPVAMDGPVLIRVAIGLLLAAVLWPLGLHRWARP